MCRAPCYTAGAPKTNIMMAAMLREAFPDREVPLSEMKCAEGGAEPASRVLPLFLASSVQLPHSTCSMHLFEPRYRLLARRALDGGGDFAMVWARGGYGFPLIVDPASLVGVVGCIVHVDQSHQMPDGRWNLICKGLAPAQIEECWVEAGNDNLYMARLIQRPESELSVDVEDAVMAPEGESTRGGEAMVGSGAEGPGAEASDVAVADSTSTTANSVSLTAEGSATTVQSTATPGVPTSRAEQLRFLCTQLHALGVAPRPEAPPSDVARFTWEAAAALAGPFGYIGLSGLQALLEQGSAAERLELLCSICREASLRRWSFEPLLKVGLQRLGPVAVIGAAIAWLLSSTGSQLAGH